MESWHCGEVTMASYGRAVTGTAVMARSANEEKKKTGSATPFNRGEVASDTGGSCVGSFPSRGGDTHATEDLCVQDI